MAALVAGDVHTKDELRDAALAAYGEAIERFARAGTANSDYADSANHFAVLALAGRAELLAGSGRADAAAADLLRAHELRPESLDATDGLQRKPRAIAGRVVDALEKAGNTELAAQLKPLLP
jgi:tetratricopeptide (TPR) repeat protein